jgi:hypothetical protein
LDMPAARIVRRFQSAADLLGVKPWAGRVLASAVCSALSSSRVTIQAYLQEKQMLSPKGPATA